MKRTAPRLVATRSASTRSTAKTRSASSWRTVCSFDVIGQSEKKIEHALIFKMKEDEEHHLFESKSLFRHDMYNLHATMKR
jgi:hypothetical protein